MHAQGRPSEPSKPPASMPATDDEIREKYLERAIRELNTLTRELQACPHCPRGNLQPVLGSGHPQADIMLLKLAPAYIGVRGAACSGGRDGTIDLARVKCLAAIVHGENENGTSCCLTTPRARQILPCR